VSGLHRPGSPDRRPPRGRGRVPIAFAGIIALVALTVVDGRILYDGRTVAGIDESVAVFVNSSGWRMISFELSRTK